MRQLRLTDEKELTHHRSGLARACRAGPSSPGAPACPPSSRPRPHCLPHCPSVASLCPVSQSAISSVSGLFTPPGAWLVCRQRHLFIEQCGSAQAWRPGGRALVHTAHCILVCTPHCTLNTAHYILHTTYCTQHTAHYILDTTQCILHIANCTKVHTAHIPGPPKLQWGDYRWPLGAAVTKGTQDTGHRTQDTGHRTQHTFKNHVINRPGVAGAVL